jgi:carboxyl-terminal processing protease
MIRRLLLVLMSVAWLAPVTEAARPSSQDSLYEQIRNNISLFGDVYRETTLRYVDSIDPEKFVRAGIEGMLSTLDPYTVFIPQDETEDLDLITSGRYGGVGIEIGVRGRDKVLTVISAMDDSPAQRVGIRSGDRIIEIDTMSTQGFSTSDAARLLRGPAGTQVRLLVERTGSSEPIEFVITRRDIEIKDVPYYGFVQPGVGYVKLAHFSRGAAEELDRALAELRPGGAQALILDLRGNPGGLLSSAVAVAQRFCLKGEEILAVRGRHSESDQVFRAQADPAIGDLPLAVLVDGGSASASEIVAGAIQDLDRGVLVGETTFGKGLVQSVVSFETGEALKLTTAEYYTPSGRLIQKVDYFHDGDGVVRAPAEQPEQYTTHNGRPVHGGGGITPDLIVPTPQPGPLGTELWRQGTFFDFVNDYRARHPNLTSEKLGEEGLREFRSWLDSTHFQYDADGRTQLNSLRHLAEQDSMADSLAAEFQDLERFVASLRERDFRKEQEFIRRSLEGELAADLFGSRGRIESSFESDEAIQCALKVLSDRAEYTKLLSAPGK